MTRSPPPSQPQHNPASRASQSIPLQNLARPPGDDGPSLGSFGGRGNGLASQSESRSQDQSQPARRHDGGSYQHLSPTTAQMAANLPGLSTYWENPYGLTAHHDDGGPSPESPIDPLALQYSLPPDINQPRPQISRAAHSNISDFYDPNVPYYDDPTETHDHGGPHAGDYESDRVPLTSQPQPISGSLAPAEAQPRDSFQTVSDIENSSQRARDTRMLGDDLELGDSARKRHISYGDSLTPDGSQRRSRSPSASGAFSKAGSIVRAMSTRVVNLSGENDVVEQEQARRRQSRMSKAESLRRSQRVVSGDAPPVPSLPSMQFMDTSYTSQVYPSPQEKLGQAEYPFGDPVAYAPRRTPMPNPLKGKSLGVFSPENPIRKKLCDLLVLPWTEPLILLLIILQTVLLAVDAAPDVWKEGNQRPQVFGDSSIDWALLGLFVVFTVEIVARIIVSGFLMNASEYSTIDRKRGVRAAVADQYRSIFQLQRERSVTKKKPQENYGPSTFARSFTVMQGQALPETVEEQQRFQLARRAFLRHSFNRFDFIAVVSFWISFVLSITGLESGHQLYVFRMLSCLRILRLLALTNGTAIILRSLKKAAPLLVRVSFLVTFFWIIFAIIGVQSFKSSFKRQCVWIDPDDPLNLDAAFTNEFQFCGGYINKTTGYAETWKHFLPGFDGDLARLASATTDPKGFLCPRGSICLQQANPFNGTVNFDNIAHSMELVFVIMSANTFSDLMYWTTNSDYLPAALFFGAGIMIMMLWLTNLLIAVITSSFQVIREESKSSAFTADQEPFRQPRSEEAYKRLSGLQHVYERTRIFWLTVITYDLICQATQKASMRESHMRLVENSEIVVTLLLDVEIIFRFVADWRHFHRRSQNLLDLALAIVTSIILIPPIHESGKPYAWLTLFQVLRAYRIVMAIPATSKLIRLVLGNATGIGNLMLFVFLITFLMAIFAVQLFRGVIPAYDDDGELIEISFSTIFNSFLGMYQILSSENWTSIMYNVTAYTAGSKVSWVAAIFFIGWFVLSFFILVNMFIAVIQENFDVSEDEKRLEQVKAFLQKKELGKSHSSNLALSTIFTLGRPRRRRDPLDYGPATMEMLLKDAVLRDFIDEQMDPLAQTPTHGQSPHGDGKHAEAAKPGLLASMWNRIVATFSSRDPNPFYSNIRFDGPNEALDPRQMARQAVSATAARRKAQREYLARHPKYNNSLFIFSPDNPLRRLCQRIVGPGRGTERFDGVEPNKIAWYTFSAFIYAAIVAMVILACVATPLYQREYLRTHPFSLHIWPVWTDLAFATLFTIEAGIKVVADGFLWTPNAYFRSSWGIIDGVVLITLWINIITLLANDGAVSRAVGAFKALRALRLLNVSDSARDTFHSLIIVGGWKILSAAFVSVSLLIPFAIYGLNLFKGQMISCNDGSDAISNLVDCFGEYNSTPFNPDWEMLAPRAAANPYFSFDDFSASIFTLFQIVSQEGWTDVSFAAQAIRGPGLQPEDLVSQGNAVFFVVFNLLATVFVLTLFISVFMRNYTEQTGVAFLTTDQRSWLELRKLLRQISPSKSSYDDSEKRWKKWCHKRAIEKRGKWYMGITCVLILHLVLLMLEYYEEPGWWTHARSLIFLAFNLIYIANIGIRIVGLGWTRFRKSSWDVFSLFAVAGSFITSILLQTRLHTFDAYTWLHKLFLVSIVLLLIPRNDALDQLFKTAAASLTTIGNLLATWLVFFLVFAIAMTQTFSLTRFGREEDNHVNLRTVPHALILLFRMSVGEGWNQVMEDYASIKPPFCTESTEFTDSDCGSTSWARFLFVAWNIISMYIFVNLFVSLIYESFSYVYQRSSGLAHVNRVEIRRFKEAWRAVDPAGTGYISKEAFPRLLGELSGIFEMRVYDPENSVRSILDDVRSENNLMRHGSVTTASGGNYMGVDLNKLNRRLAQIDVVKVRERRRRFDIFFEEVMVSADPDRGISFTTVLMILAHYNIISDSKSLRLEEFLKRRARLQRVEEEVRRRVVVGFFDTLYWSRRFRRHMDKKHAGRMTGIPQLDVPEIYVEDEDNQASGNGGNRTPASARSLSPTSGYLRTDPQHRSWSNSADFSALQHPLSAPRNHPTSPTHRPNQSAFSFELQEGGTSSGENSRRGSSVSPAQVREMLDDSIWVESIRRSATVTRTKSGGGSFR